MALELLELLEVIGQALGGVARRGERRAAEKRREIDVLWSVVAGRMGAFFSPFDQTRSQPRARMIRMAEPDGLEVVVSHSFPGALGGIETWAVARPRGVGQLGLDRLSANARGELEVEARNHLLTRAWFGGSAGLAIARSGGEVSSDGESLRLARTGLPGADALEAMISAGQAMARGGRRLMATWRAAAATLGGELMVDGVDWPTSGEVVIRLGNRDEIRATPVGTRVRRTLRVRDPRSGLAELDVLVDSLEPDLERWKQALTALRAQDGGEPAPYR
jgi:hypothetical protein